MMFKQSRVKGPYTDKLLWCINRIYISAVSPLFFLQMHIVHLIINSSNMKKNMRGDTVAAGVKPGHWFNFTLLHQNTTILTKIA